MPMRTGTPMPELTGATEWINGQPNREELIGNPVLVHFWATSCHICHENMPTLNAWRKEYGPQGLKMVSIHMPRQEADTNVDRVLHDAEKMGVTDPLGIDNEHAMAEAFHNKYVPAYFLFDREGNLRSRAAGDAGLTMLEGTLKRQFAPKEAE
jgi:thiol-disulfide isomerase/thioredoxin